MPLPFLSQDKLSVPRFGKPAFDRTPSKRGETALLPSMRAKAIVVLASVVGAITFGAIGATGYWAFSDDMLDAARTDQIALESAYQDRIDRLRAEINRLTSRQAIDRESIEQQVSDLVRKQQLLNERHSIVSTLMERAERSGIQLAIRNPLPSRKPDGDSGPLSTAIDEDASAIGGESEPLKDPLKALGLRGSSSAMPEAPANTITPSTGEQAALDKVQMGITSMARESTATINRREGAVMKVPGSRASTPNRSPSSTRPPKSAQTTPRETPTTTGSSPFRTVLVATVAASAPKARRIPISWVRSVTLTSMIFMIPIPPTISETPATHPSKERNAAVVASCVPIISCCVVTVKSASSRESSCLFASNNWICKIISSKFSCNRAHFLHFSSIWR